MPEQKLMSGTFYGPEAPSQDRDKIVANVVKSINDYGNIQAERSKITAQMLTNKMKAKENWFYKQQELNYQSDYQKQMMSKLRQQEAGGGEDFVVRRGDKGPKIHYPSDTKVKPAQWEMAGMQESLFKEFVKEKEVTAKKAGGFLDIGTTPYEGIKLYKKGKFRDKKGKLNLTKALKQIGSTSEEFTSWAKDKYPDKSKVAFPFSVQGSITDTGGEKDKFGYTVDEERDTAKGKYKYMGNDQWQKI